MYSELSPEPGSELDPCALRSRRRSGISPNFVLTDEMVIMDILLATLIGNRWLRRGVLGLWGIPSSVSTFLSPFLSPPPPPLVLLVLVLSLLLPTVGPWASLALLLAVMVAAALVVLFSLLPLLWAAAGLLAVLPAVLLAAALLDSFLLSLFDSLARRAFLEAAASSLDALRDGFLPGSLRVFVDGGLGGECGTSAVPASDAEALRRRWPSPDDDDDEAAPLLEEVRDRREGVLASLCESWSMALTASMRDELDSRLSASYGSIASSCLPMWSSPTRAALSFLSVRRRTDLALSGTPIRSRRQWKGSQ